MNSVGYPPPALPARKDVNYSLSDIDKALGELETAGASLAAILFGALYQNPLSLNALSLPKGLLVLLRGVTSDKYAELPPADFQNPGLPGAVILAQLTAVPAGQGVTVDNTQPYPLTGWIEVRWSRFDGYVRFRNVWQTTEYMNIQSGTPTAGTVDPGEWSADWVLQTPATTNGDPPRDGVLDSEPMAVEPKAECRVREARQFGSSGWLVECAVDL